MGLKSALSIPYAKLTAGNIRKWSSHPRKTQEKVLHQLISKAAQTQFGKAHQFEKINTYEDFKKHVPIRDYEALKPYFDELVKGKPDVLWPGLPIYFAKTSGTTSGTKYIPITKDSISNHIHSARNALLGYIAETGNGAFVDGKMIFLQGNPTLTETSGIPTGRLSGIVAHHVPNYLLKNRMPSWETNCISDWETKVNAIVEETLEEDMRLISGIPSWVQMYFERLLEVTGKKTVMDVFPNFSLFVYGGVSYAPYRGIFKKLIGKEIPSVETYPASEGFIAFQDRQANADLLMVLNKGIFYEFIPQDEIGKDKPTRLPIWETEVGKNYALIINSNAGLWGYNLGDVVKVVSKNPYRVIVSGRTKHFISAFGEHVIAEEVESAIGETQELFNCRVTEFHVAPQVNPGEGHPYHEWFIEFDGEPANLDAFAIKMDKILQEKNPYYADLLNGNILQTLKITRIKKEGFKDFMKSRGKLGGQNKLPRLANDRSLANELVAFTA